MSYTWCAQPPNPAQLFVSSPSSASCSSTVSPTRSTSGQEKTRKRRCQEGSAKAQQITQLDTPHVRAAQLRMQTGIMCDYGHFVMIHHSNSIRTKGSDRGAVSYVLSLTGGRPKKIARMSTCLSLHRDVPLGRCGSLHLLPFARHAR